MRISTRQIAVASLLGALSIISELVPGPPFDIRFPLYDRVSWDLTGIPMMISLLLYGPVTGLYTCLVGCSFLMLRNPIGGLFKLIAELATLLPYGILDRGTVIRTIFATASRVFAMTIANYYLLQFFYNVPETVVVGLLPVLALFNLSQALINILPSIAVSNRVGHYLSAIRA